MCDYCFFSNQQRFDEFKSQLDLEKVVITTNISTNVKMEKVVELKNISYIENKFVTNVAILMLNYLILNKLEKVEIAGLDGYQIGKNNYAYDETNVVNDDKLFGELNQSLALSLQNLKDLIKIELVTPSIYSKISGGNL